MHGPASYRCARSLGLGEHDAEDVAQEVLLKLLGVMARYDPEKAAIGTLVYRMTMNATADHRRKPARREVRADTGMIRAVPDPDSHDEAERLEHGELRELITATVHELPERQRQVCVLHDLEGMSVADTAHTLEITPTNVRVHLTHARRALRERLARILEG